MKDNQRIALTKRLLQEALLRLMNKKSLEKITITELCEEAGINRTTFYRHFNVPSDVLLDMNVEFFKRLNDSISLSNAKDIPSYIEELMSYLYEHSELLKIFLQNSSPDDFMRLADGVFESFIEATNKFTEIFDADDENLKLISTYIAGGSYSMLRCWLLENIQKTPREISDLILKFMNYSVNFLDQH